LSKEIQERIFFHFRNYLDLPVTHGGHRLPSPGNLLPIPFAAFALYLGAAAAPGMLVEVCIAAVGGGGRDRP
jgi:hypothetical protein